MRKLAIVSTHPVQYNAPVFKLLQQRGRIGVRVFYTWGDTVLRDKYDPGFGKVIQWDIPLLDGYEYEFLENRSTDKGTHHFKGIDNPGIIDAITAYDPDAILVYGWPFKSHLRVLRHFHGRKTLLFRGDSTMLDDRSFIKSLLRRVFLYWVYRHIDKAFYVGTNNRKYFQRTGLRDDQLVYAPHTVDNDRFRCTEDCKAQGAAFRRELGIPADALVFLFAGKLESKKDPMLLLEAFAGAGLHQSAHLVFVGDGVLGESLMARAKEIKTVHFIGFQNQSKMVAVYGMGDVFVLPSRGPEETWGLAINESMAAGRAVIASDKCGGAIDLILPGENGFIFKAGDMQSLQDALLAIAKDRGQISAMGARSRELIGNFGMEILAQTIEETMG